MARVKVFNFNVDKKNDILLFHFFVDLGGLLKYHLHKRLLL